MPSELKETQFTEEMSRIISEIKAALANSRKADIRMHEALLASLYIQIAVKIKLLIQKYSIGSTK